MTARKNEPATKRANDWLLHEPGARDFGTVHLANLDERLREALGRARPIAGGTS